MSNVPDINLMREMAEEKTDQFNEEFSKSEVFKKMCSDIQKEASKGNFSKHFNMSGLGGSKGASAARDLFVKGGYKTSLSVFNLIVSWGRTYEETEE